MKIRSDPAAITNINTKPIITVSEGNTRKYYLEAVSTKPYTNTYIYIDIYIYMLILIQENKLTGTTHKKKRAFMLK